MGCGGDVLEAGQVFRMYVAFFDAVTGKEVELDSRMLASFVAKINDIVKPGKWDKQDQAVLLRGPITDAHQMNRAVNSVLRGLRVDSNRLSTGKAGRVTNNQGPALDGSEDKGDSHPPSTVDDYWSPNGLTEKADPRVLEPHRSPRRGPVPRRGSGKQRPRRGGRPRHAAKTKR
jgi:hypothetical protein